MQDVFTLLPSAEIRALREESPSNLATLCYKGVEKLVSAGTDLYLENKAFFLRKWKIGSYYKYLL